MNAVYNPSSNAPFPSPRSDRPLGVKSGSRSFVDLWFDAVDQWGKEDPGAFTAKDGIEEVRLRTCTPRDVVLSSHGAKIRLYAVASRQPQDKVVDDSGSIRGSHRTALTSLLAIRDSRSFSSSH